MSFDGKVIVKIYFGTLYDDINIPWMTHSIRTSATKTITTDGNFVWQTAWLSSLRVSVDSTDVVEGAQFVEIAYTDGRRSRWYQVLSNQAVNNKTVDLGLYYDVLLTVGMDNITGISGTLKRWSVNDDAAFKWIGSPEPVGQTAPYNFSYFSYNCADGTSGTPLVGFNASLDDQPEIKLYQNSAASETSSAYIYYPSLSQVPAQGTIFNSTIGGTFQITDGLAYYDWNTAGTAKQNFDYAVGLAYDLVTNSYILPASSLISVTKVDSSRVTQVIGGTDTKATGLSKTDGGYNNAKAGEIGIEFTLFNPMSGDSVSCNNYDIKDNSVSVILAAHPYSGGSFFARFRNYQGGSTGGWVKSASWRPYTLTAGAAAGQSSALLDYATSVDSYQSAYNYQSGLRNITYAGQNINTEYQRKNIDLAEKVANYSLGGTALSSVISAAGEIVGGGTGISSAGGLVNGALSLASQQASLALQRSQLDELTTLQAEQRLLDVGYAYHNYRRQMQAAALNLQVALSAPPACKYATSSLTAADSYNFVVRKATLAAADRLRMDRFFTAYGYNTDGELLNSVTQLNTRTRFTFIQADNVYLQSSTAQIPLDLQTLNEIQTRFSAGLRIWPETPDFDWSKANPIRS